MAQKGATQVRVTWAYQELLKSRPTHHVVADLAKREGLSKRQARRYVGQAHMELFHDLDTLERPQMLAKCVLALEASIQRSLEAGHGAAVVGAVRTLAELCQLTTASNSSKPPGRRFG